MELRVEITSCDNCGADWAEAEAFDATELAEIARAVAGGYCYCCTAPLGAEVRHMIGAMPNYHTEVATVSEHLFALPAMCPVSHNPRPGSTITIRYTADRWFLEIISLGEYIDSYIGGRPLGHDLIRDMEQTIQQIAIDCAQVLEVPLEVVADLKIADAPEWVRTVDYRLVVRAGWPR